MVTVDINVFLYLFEDNINRHRQIVILAIKIFATICFITQLSALKHFIVKDKQLVLVLLQQKMTTYQFFKSFSEHRHPSHLSKPKTYQATANIKEATSNSQQSLRALFINFPANLDTTTCSLMPSFKCIMCYYKLEIKKE